MPHPNKHRVIEFLTDNPYGAPVWQIAQFLGSELGSTTKTLRIMAGRNEVVVNFTAKERFNDVWMIPVASEAPPIFRAKEILQAMQVAARNVYQTRALEAV